MPADTPEDTEGRSEIHKPANEGAMILRQIMQDVERGNRRQYAIKILNQAAKYVMGHLDDYDIKVEKDYTGEPLVLVIKVWSNVGLSKSEGDKK